MHNFKYHTVEELEKLVDNLKEEIAHLRKTVENTNSTELQKRTLKESEDLLSHAEYEVLERTLLK